MGRNGVCPGHASASAPEVGGTLSRARLVAAGGTRTTETATAECIREWNVAHPFGVEEKLYSGKGTARGHTTSLSRCVAGGHTQANQES